MAGNARIFILMAAMTALRADHLFATHPPTEERIARLKALTRG